MRSIARYLQSSFASAYRDRLAPGFVVHCRLVVLGIAILVVYKEKKKSSNASLQSSNAFAI